MVFEKIIIIDEEGLHARPAALLAGAALKCSSRTMMRLENKTINLKDVLEILFVSVKKGQEVEIICEGKTEQEDLKKLMEILKAAP